MSAMLWLFACHHPDDAPRREDTSVEGPDRVDTGGETAVPPTTREVRVRATLDGVPEAGIVVLQGGRSERWTTDATGELTLTLDLTVEGDVAVVGAHPEARSYAELVYDSTEEVWLDLRRYDPVDNPDYPFADPGEGDPLDADSTQCLHCHATIHADWWDSAHRSAAKNPVVHDVYQGLASAGDASACAEAGGAWTEVREPGTGEVVEGCVVDRGVDATGTTGACADCHAPGIDGELGGRDLLEATGIAYDYGVHCDVCHRVESVDLDAPPGVAGRLVLHRPSEPSTSPAFGAWMPLTFGPWDDVPNPRMGGVQREVYHASTFCAGCHEQSQPAWLGAVDLARWPDGTLPIHTTYSEWEASALNPAAPCQSCHMPPDPETASGADLYAAGHGEDGAIGISTGWERPPGSVRVHGFYGPRQPDAGLLGLAATVDVEARVEDGEVVAAVTVENVGPGHAIPTGEPLRALLLTVEARCDGLALAPTGGDVLPDWAGAVATRAAGEDWSLWPEAQPGDEIRVVRRTGEWVDYVGFGPFGDGTFDAEAKGLPVEAAVGRATVLAVEDGVVTLDAPLPDGDVAYLGRGQAWAGAPGFAFARVLVDAEGTPMVPHFQAVDVRSDNRLLPGAAWTSTHRFAADCAEPEVSATLWHRNYPWALARARGWTVTDQLMAEVTR